VEEFIPISIYLQPIIPALFLEFVKMRGSAQKSADYMPFSHRVIGIFGENNDIVGLVGYKGFLSSFMAAAQLHQGPGRLTIHARMLLRAIMKRAKYSKPGCYYTCGPLSCAWVV
jgi:hypothetical protein